MDASVVKNGKGKKVVIFKYKPKKGYRLRQGHRQPYTKVDDQARSTPNDDHGILFTPRAAASPALPCAGHSGLAPRREDIVCAAVTSAVRLTECAVNDVLGLQAAVKVNDQDASITLKLPGEPGSVRPTR